MTMTQEEIDALIQSGGIEEDPTAAEENALAEEESTNLESPKFPDIDSVVKFIKKIKRTGDIIFVKGSRALGMERIINNLCKGG